MTYNKRWEKIFSDATRVCKQWRTCPDSTKRENKKLVRCPKSKTFFFFMHDNISKIYYAC